MLGISDSLLHPEAMDYSRKESSGKIKAPWSAFQGASIQ